jgi:nucleotide-binding universal stress UspA family protein
MISFDRILFPVDFSEQCKAIAPAVQSLAEQFHSKITVLHVADLPIAWFGTPETAAWSALVSAGRLREEHRIALNRFVEKHFSGVSVDQALEEGQAGRLIADYANDVETNLIMMPTRGYGPFRAFLLGSVTAKVLHDAHCPVWTSAHAERFEPETARWNQVLCALDTDPRDVAVLRWAAEFACASTAGGPPINLRLVHAVEGASNRESDPGLYQFLFQIARERMAKMQSEAGTSFEICFLPGKVGHAVRQAAFGHNADLVVVGRGVLQKTLGRLRSNAYSIIRQAPCPVISI